MSESPRADSITAAAEKRSMTEFLEDHPGGSEIIMNNRSKDVTPIFNPRHPSDQLDVANIPPNVKHLGELDVGAASEDEKEAIRLKVSDDAEEESKRIEREREAMEERGLGVIVNMKDFEAGRTSCVGTAAHASRNTLNPCCQKWLWHTMRLRATTKSVSLLRSPTVCIAHLSAKVSNATAYQNVVFRPRILRKVAAADASTTILGKESKIPVFISPA